MGGGQRHSEEGRGQAWEEVQEVQFCRSHPFKANEDLAVLERTKGLTRRPMLFPHNVGFLSSWLHDPLEPPDNPTFTSSNKSHHNHQDNQGASASPGEVLVFVCSLERRKELKPRD